MYALSETSGATLWTAGVENGDHSSPTVTGDGVYVSYAGPQSYKFNPTSGSLTWHFSSGVEGGGGKTTVYYNGDLYVRDIYDSSLPNQNVLVLNGTSGKASTTFHDSSFTVSRWEGMKPSPSGEAFRYTIVDGKLSNFCPYAF